MIRSGYYAEGRTRPQPISVASSNESSLKGSPHPSHFIFEINVGKSRIQHLTTLNLNEATSNRFWLDLEIQFQSRPVSDPTFSDIDFKNKMAWVWTTLKIIFIFTIWHLIALTMILSVRFIHFCSLNSNFEFTVVDIKLE